MNEYHAGLQTPVVLARVLQNIDRLCCGMMFDTRGAKRAAGLKVAESSTELLLASQMGKLPIGEPDTAAMSCPWQD